MINLTEREKESHLASSMSSIKQFALDALSLAGVVAVFPLPFGSIPAGVIEYKTRVGRRTLLKIVEHAQNATDYLFEKYFGGYQFVPEAYKEPLKAQLAIIFLILILASIKG